MKRAIWLLVAGCAVTGVVWVGVNGCGSAERATTPPTPGVAAVLTPPSPATNPGAGNGPLAVTPPRSEALSSAATDQLQSDWARRDRANGQTGFVAGIADKSQDYRAVRQHTDFNAQHAESYDHLSDNAFWQVSARPLSTFSVDVDTASYSNVRRYIESGQLPPPDAVRVEELINYFPYNYPQPTGDVPFSVNVETTVAPWAQSHRLVRIGLRGKEFARENRPQCNLVFLIDTSGSMQQPNRLPLVKRALADVVRKLSDRDMVTIVTYAGNAGLALPTTNCANRGAILAVLDHLEAGGSTNGGAGIQLAYDLAKQHYVTGGVNRVMICTDGDFNVGITDRNSLTHLIEEKAKSGVYLSVLGFGMGNLKEATLEELSRRGNGNFAYIDSIAEARKVLVEQAAGTLVTIAKDVKIQVEFNPAVVAEYRLIGYENRLLRDREFNDDTKDAGDVGAGHTVTALYEVVPAAGACSDSGVDPLKYQKAEERPPVSLQEMLTIKLRYKGPESAAVQGTSRLVEIPVRDGVAPWGRASSDTRFAAAVAEFGMLLRKSPYVEGGSMSAVSELVQATLSDRRDVYSVEFAELVGRVEKLQGGPAAEERAER